MVEESNNPLCRVAVAELKRRDDGKAMICKSKSCLINSGIAKATVMAAMNDKGEERSVG